MKIKKRDGRIVSFDKSFIEKAIKKACDEVNENVCSINEIVENVANKCYDGIDVEAIQDFVEQELIAAGAVKVAKAYILYRNERNKARARYADAIINGIINAERSDVTRENANSDSNTPAGMMMKFASERGREFADMHLISKEAGMAIENNLLHVHDKDYMPTKSLTCIQHPMDKLLSDGFKAGHGESRSAKRIETASILSCISMETIQNEMHGGQAIPAFDFYLAPFVRKTYIEEIKKIEDIQNTDYSELYNSAINDYIEKELGDTVREERVKQQAINQTVSRVYQSMEAFVHNMNSIHSRGGNQVVFSSINYGTDTSAEGRCIIRELLKTTYRGVGNGSTAIFPIQIWKMKNGINKRQGEPNYDLFEFACKVTAKRFFPNFLNLDAPFNKSDKWKADDSERYKHEVATMGCVDGEEIITWKVKEEVFITSFQDFWNYQSELSPQTDSKLEGYQEGQFIDLHDVQILDYNGFVDCLRVIKNPDKGDWVSVTLADGHQLTTTSDHPWSIIGKGVVLAKNLNIGDAVLSSVKDECRDYCITDFDLCKITKIEYLGFRNKDSFDVTTASKHFVVSGIRSHNCRTRVFEDRFGESTSIGRGNLSFSTINLPGLALSVMNEPDKEKRISTFFDKLKDMVWVTGRQLYDRYQFQCTAMAKQFPLLMSGMWVGSENLKPEDEVRPVLKHGTLGVGFIGLAECLIALIGKHHGESDEAQQLGLKIITFMRDEAKKLSDHYDLNYSILATPAEGLSGKFTKKDKKKYGIIKGVTDKDYYTNSNHVPVYYHCSAAHKAKIEAPYHDLTRGGHIFYVELDGDATHNVQAVMDIVKLIDKYNIGYGSINHNRNRCLDCGYEDASKNLTTCPRCGSERIDKLQRITGYLVGTTDRWNSGKLAELKDRVTHD